MKQEQKKRLVALSMQMRHGDKQLLADLFGFTKQHLTDIMNGKKNSVSHGQLIIRASEMLLESREQYIERLKIEKIIKPLTIKQ